MTGAKQHSGTVKQEMTSRTFSGSGQRGSIIWQQRRSVKKCKNVSGLLAWVILLWQFLDALVKLRHATISFVISACPSVRMQQLCIDLTGFE
jgi:hypothetical protein